MLVVRGYNFACLEKRSNCTTIPTLLSMIVDIYFSSFHFFLLTFICMYKIEEIHQ